MTFPTQKLISIFAASLFGFGLASCGKKEAANVSVAPTNQEVAQAPDAPVGPPAMQSPPQTEAPRTLSSDPAELNRELRKWILRNRRPPKNFEEFAASAGVQFPPPPDGKKYAIDKTMHVILVKR